MCNIVLIPIEHAAYQVSNNNGIPGVEQRDSVWQKNGLSNKEECH